MFLYLLKIQQNPKICHYQVTEDPTDTPILLFFLFPTYTIVVEAKVYKSHEGKLIWYS